MLVGGVCYVAFVWFHILVVGGTQTKRTFLQERLKMFRKRVCFDVKRQFRTEEIVVVAEIVNNFLLRLRHSSQLLFPRKTVKHPDASRTKIWNYKFRRIGGIGCGAVDKSTQNQNFQGNR